MSCTNDAYDRGEEEHSLGEPPPDRTIMKVRFHSTFDVSSSVTTARFPALTSESVQDCCSSSSSRDPLVMSSTRCPSAISSMRTMTTRDHTVSFQPTETFGGSSSSQDRSCISQRRFSVQSAHFVQPCTAMKVSGGTAAFFNVRYLPGLEPQGVDPNFFLGKDLAHARDEVGFYERLFRFCQPGTPWEELGKAVLWSPGICTMNVVRKTDTDEEEEVAEVQERRELLLLQNMRTGFKQLRLLDIKLGDQTSVAGWKGKSTTHAIKNRMIDHFTNSQREGYRLEGMDSPPSSLTKRTTAIIKGRKSLQGIYTVPDAKSLRILLQQMRAHEILSFWVDMFRHGPQAEAYSHGVLWNTVSGLSSVVQGLLDVPVPQQWIGTSLALGTEAHGIQDDPAVIVKVFDWGRAELLSEEEYAELPVAQRKTRIYFWRQYCKAMVRLRWELLRLVAHRCCCEAWRALVFELELREASMIRDVLLGPQELCVKATTLYQIHGSDITERGRDLMLPLFGRHCNGKDSVKFLQGMLYLNIRQKEEEGRQHVTVLVRGASGLPDIALPEESLITTVRIVAFEHVDDAKSHLHTWHTSTQEEPAPKGRAYELRTRPGVWHGKSVLWGKEEDQFQFRGLGTCDAAEAQERLLKELPTDGYGGDVTSGSDYLNHTSRTDGVQTTIPELMVGTVGRPSGEDIPPQLVTFWRRTAGWLDEGHPVPPHWLANDA